jgi:hypothetical protein
MAEKDTTKQGVDPSNDQNEVDFKYVKSNFFRVIHADGAWGGVSPKGSIHMSFYNERAALPDSSKLIFSKTGELVGSEQYHASSRIVRELECDLIVDFGTARQLRDWLSETITKIEGMVREVQENETPKREEASNGQKMALKG